MADLVRDALVLELGKNGHPVVPSERDVVLAATVEDFRLDEVAAYASTRYVGRVVIALDVVDGRSGEILLTRRYVGIKRRDIDKVSDDARRETMDAALARTMHVLRRVRSSRRSWPASAPRRRRSRASAGRPRRCVTSIRWPVARWPIIGVRPLTAGAFREGSAAR